MNKFILIALLAINSVYSIRYKCMDKIGAAPTGKCLVADYLDTRYVSKCKTGLVCDFAGSIDEDYDVTEVANWGQCIAVKIPGAVGQVCADSAECGSNNCANLACAEQADERCNNDFGCAAGRFCAEDGYCQNLRLSGAKCAESKECPPYNVCNSGRCTKIGEVGSGGVSNDLDEDFANIVCEHGVTNESGECKKISDESTNYCVYDSVNSIYTHTVTFDDGSTRTTECRTNILTGAPYPAINIAKQNAFDNYKAAISNNPKGNADSIWEFKNNRIHGDNKEVKAALTAYLYPELADGDDDAVCVRNYMQQYILSSNNIKFSKIMILLFALFI